MLILLPVATAFLVYSMVFQGTESIVAIISYVLAFYTLTVWCLKIPDLINIFKSFKDTNKLIKRFNSDVDLRVKISLYSTLIWNTAYGVFQLALGFWHHTFWYYSLAGYYISLAVIRYFLARYTTKNKAGRNLKEELLKYRACGIAFLIMNVALTFIIFFMVYWNRTFVHHQITTIAMATYTFTAFTMAIINVFKYCKYNSPVYWSTKAISLAAACVSMLTLEATMLTTFGTDTDMHFRKLMLGISGAAVSIFIISMAIYMIVNGTKKIKSLKENSNGKQQRL